MENLTEFPLFGTSVDYTCSPLSIVVVGISTAILLRGAKDSTAFNNLMTIANISMLLMVVVAGMGSGSLEMDNLTPFAPQGVPGVLAGAGLVFFAFIGFDQVASLSEEVIHPERNMPIGIVGSLVVSTLIYVTVALTVVSMASFRYLGETVPIVNALLVNACCSHEQQIKAIMTEECLQQCQVFQKPVLLTIAHIVSGGVIFGLMAACFTSLMGQPRIFYRMALDGLWFPAFAEVDPVTKVPSKGIKVTGIVCAFLACFVPLEALANLISLGTLMVFTFVDAGVILLRLRRISDAACASARSYNEKADLKRRLASMNQTVVLLLMLFTCALLAASITLRNFDMIPIMWLQAAIAGFAAISIVAWPTSWTTQAESESIGHISQFECPWVPIIPLCGMACNTIMMGSLPVPAWCCFGIWLGSGIVFYFSYGIHHSTLGLKPLDADSVPLVTTALLT